MIYLFYLLLQSSKKEHRKAVFISQTTNTQLQSIREIILHSDFTHCILISCVSLDVVYMELNENKDVSDILASGRAPAEATKQLESMLLEWIAKTVCIYTMFIITKYDITHIYIYHNAFLYFLLFLYCIETGPECDRFGIDDYFVVWNELYLYHFLTLIILNSYLKFV